MAPLADPAFGSQEALAEARALVERLTAQVSPPEARVLGCVAEALGSPDVFLPRLPEAAIQAAQVVDSPRCDVLDLADTINADPAIAARVVRIAGTGFFAGTEPIHTPRDAIVRMGIRETRNVVMGLVLRDLICSGPGRKEARLRLWQHSLATAACAHGLLCELAIEDSVGFLGGLAHDLGRAVLYGWLGERPEADVSDPVLEPISDALHPVLGAAILASWRLRWDLVDAVRWHHEPLGTREGADSMAFALQIADWMAHSICDTETSSAAEDPRIESALLSLELSPERSEGLRAQSRARLEELRKIF